MEISFSSLDRFAIRTVSILSLQRDKFQNHSAQLHVRDTTIARFRDENRETPTKRIRGIPRPRTISPKLARSCLRAVFLIFISKILTTSYLLDELLLVSPQALSHSAAVTRGEAHPSVGIKGVEKLRGSLYRICIPLE